MGFMLRYHPGFSQIAEWARSGFLGNVYSVRAHMSTNITEAGRKVIAAGHHGGIFYDLAGHMLDQVVWILGRPEKVTTFLRNDTGVVPAFQDNTLGVFEYERAMAWVDIAAMEPQPMARRFEVYGDRGSAILLEPFEPGHAIRLCLTEAADGYTQGRADGAFRRNFAAGALRTRTSVPYKSAQRRTRARSLTRPRAPRAGNLAARDRAYCGLSHASASTRLIGGDR